MQGQIPKGSKLLDDLIEFKELNNKKEQEIHELHNQILEINKTFKEDDHLNEDFENEKESYKSKIKSEIKNNLLQEYISAVKESSSILAKIDFIEEMEDQIPNNSILFEELGKFNNIYNEKKEKPFEILDKLTKIDGASNENNIPLEELELFFQTEKDNFKKEINKWIEEKETEEEKLKRLNRLLDELQVELATVRAKCDAIKKRKSENKIPLNSPILEELKSSNNNLLDLKVKIKEKKEELKEADNSFDMENDTSENYAGIYEDKFEFFIGQIDQNLEKELRMSMIEKLGREIKFSFKKWTTNAAKMKATNDMKDQIPKNSLIQKEFSISEDANEKLESDISATAERLKELDKQFDVEIFKKTVINDMFHQEYDKYIIEIKEGIKKFLLEEYCKLYLQSAPLNAKIRATIDMKDQIPKDSSLLKDLDNNQTLFKEIEREMNETMDKLNLYDIQSETKKFYEEHDKVFHSVIASYTDEIKKSFQQIRVQLMTRTEKVQI